MHAALAMSQILLALLLPADDDNGASRWGDSWVAYGTHDGRRPGSAGSGRNGGGGGSLSNCHTIPGANGITYIQCDAGAAGQQNVFQGVVPGDPAAPTITPDMLMQEALRQLTPPAPTVATAPPRGRDGYVGLRHYFWAERDQWRSISKRATAGPVWAEVTATPTTLVFDPGAGQASISCKGPGTPYDQSRSPDSQTSNCWHSFTRSSAGLPGSQYTVTVSVVWTASWVGSGGAGGPLAPITTSATFLLRIAEGQALIQRSA
ncbi:hypothetical protein ACIBG8_54050 [Nonomuraea sp. NPDC050556]|uniref:hypothetical protein n=1 Tax=Nonomuraea sp. NPDC050556 TaxID=3364369 RepID=UPI0037B1B711